MTLTVAIGGLGAIGLQLARALDRDAQGRFLICPVFPGEGLR